MLLDLRRAHAETLAALVGSQRSPQEMAEAVEVLDPLLDARLRLADRNPELRERMDATALAILEAARGAESARSGMGVDLCLDHLRLGLDDARKLIAEARSAES